MTVIATATGTFTNYILSSNSTAPFNISNTNNPNETVTFSLPEGQLATNLNISSLQVKYDSVDPTQAVSQNLQTQSLITIDALDSSGIIKTINLPVNGSSYFQLSFAMTQAAQQNISSQSSSNPAYKL